jgi:predicted metal-dependent HD superfamily phosphohydrolase
MSQTKNMEIRWENLMDALKLPKHGEELRRLAEAYAQKGRHYHTLDHIRFCLEQLDHFRKFARRPALIELAIWYHDAVYDTRGTESEIKSAQLFERFAAKVGLDVRSTSFVSATICATTHKEEDLYYHPDCFLMLDIDLLPLSKPAEQFDADTRAYRKEFKHLSDEAFNARSNGFLQSLHDRFPIYRNEWVLEEFEAKAQANLNRVLATA